MFKIYGNTHQVKLARFNKKEPKKLTQDWIAYDGAKTNEDILFKELLCSLLYLAVKDKKRTHGRKPYRDADKIFSMCIKVYYRCDLRKAQSILKELKRLHYIEKVPCYKSIDNFFNEPELSKTLDYLLRITSMPLAKLEETLAIDSTGFSASRFDRWYSYKWGKKEGKERVWRKAHALCGCKTNTIISVEVTEKNVHDATMFEKVVADNPLYFEAKNFTADKAYSSRRILEFLRELQLVPYIPFRKNITGKARGSRVWAEMFEYFKDYQEEFMEKYHARSNIESTFHMVKTRFGDSVRTHSLAGNVNELKIKFLCHNICVLIQELFESGVSIDFESCVKKKILCKNTG